MRGIHGVCMSKTEKIILLIAALAVMSLLTVLLLLPKPQAQVLLGAFTPPPFEENAISGEPTVAFPQIYGTLTLTEDLAVRLYSAPVVQDGKIAVYFASKAENTLWVRLRITDENGNILGQTGLLKPGEYVESISLLKKPKSSRAVAKILTYQPETYYSMGTANANIQLQIK